MEPVAPSATLRACGSEVGPSDRSIIPRAKARGFYRTLLCKASIQLSSSSARSARLKAMANVAAGRVTDFIGVRLYEYVKPWFRQPRLLPT